MNNLRKKGETAFSREVGSKALRKIEARRRDGHIIWAGLASAGLIGWSVAIPIVLGAMLGTWLDAHHPINHSWTLALIMLGLCFGCWNAWFWVMKEHKAINKDKDHE